MTSVAATAIFTFPAGFLDDLASGDVVVFSGLTGGSGLVAGQPYYLLLLEWAAVPRRPRSLRRQTATS